MYLIQENETEKMDNILDNATIEVKQEDVGNTASNLDLQTVKIDQIETEQKIADDAESEGKRSIVPSEIAEINSELDDNVETIQKVSDDVGAEGGNETVQSVENAEIDGEQLNDVNSVEIKDSHGDSEHTEVEQPDLKSVADQLQDNESAQLICEQQSTQSVDLESEKQNIKNAEIKGERHTTNSAHIGDELQTSNIESEKDKNAEIGGDPKKNDIAKLEEEIGGDWQKVDIIEPEEEMEGSNIESEKHKDAEIGGDSQKNGIAELEEEIGGDRQNIGIVGVEEEMQPTKAVDAGSEQVETQNAGIEGTEEDSERTDTASETECHMFGGQKNAIQENQDTEETKA